MARCLNCRKKIYKISYISGYFLCQNCWEKVHNLGKLDRSNFNEDLKWKMRKKKKM